MHAELRHGLATLRDLPRRLRRTRETRAARHVATPTTWIPGMSQKNMDPSSNEMDPMSNKNMDPMYMEPRSNEIWIPVHLVSVLDPSSTRSFSGNNLGLR